MDLARAFGFADKAEVLAASERYWNPGKTRFWSDAGIPLVVGRRRIVSVVKAYHGHTGLAVAAGDERFAKLFLSDRPDEFAQVPFNDLDAMAAALLPGDVAAVLMETIPATYGFPMPEPGYLAGVKSLCEAAGTLYIADEVQTGLMRTGDLWAITKHGVRPDLLVTGKG